MAKPKWLWAAVGAAVGLVGAFACSGGARRVSGPQLPKAGSNDDDGTGVLAKWSRGGDARCVDGDCPVIDEEEYAGSYGDETYGYYGGDVYGYYGGDIYGYGGDMYGYTYYPQYVPPPAPVDRYQAATVPNGGAIEGVVTWKSAPSVTARLKAGGGCEGEVENPTLQRSSSGGVAYTLVYLSDIAYGKSYSTLGGTLEQRGCSFAPHMQLAAPIGAMMQIANQDPFPHAVRVTPTDPARKDHGQTFSLPTMKVREMSLLAADTYEVRSDDDQASAVAWVVVPRHPYYAITDADGRFRLDDVPPGEYTLVAWHEPVVTSIDAKGQTIRTAPVEVRTRVKVTAGKATTVSVDLR